MQAASTEYDSIVSLSCVFSWLFVFPFMKHQLASACMEDDVDVFIFSSLRNVP